MAKHKTHYEDCDVLVVGGGMAGMSTTKRRSRQDDTARHRSPSVPES